MDPIIAGRQAFHDTLDEELAFQPDANWRVAGKNKPTKAAPNGEDEKFWRDNGPKWVEKYAQWRFKNPDLQVWMLDGVTPAIELEINVEVSPGIILKGSIDRVFHQISTDDLHIVDLKSGKSAQSSPLQLGFYALGLHQQFGVNVRWGSFYDARKGELDARYDLNQFPPDLIRRWLRNMDRAVKIGDFTPNVGRDCAWCGMKPHCYVWNPDVERPDFLSDVTLGQEDVTVQ